MISNQILQDTVTGIKSITRVELCVMDTEGKILATTMRGMEEYEDEVVKFSESAADSQVIRGFQFFKVYDENELEYVILAKGDAEDVYMIGKMATLSRTCCLTTCFWWIFTTVRRSCTLRQM